ncbi:hypothetical protein TIFTF001_029421 [Ficus carica]|uniref:Uncharacterized protein n=1 Tax=Ficus carica TaxID=3494 RepID=A0AA88DSG5_FICCA|nr:hypothetical protein TIFTF001_029421 [Ficus carica]
MPVHHAAVKNPSYVLKNHDLVSMKIRPRAPSAKDDDNESFPIEIFELVAEGIARFSLVFGDLSVVAQGLVVIVSVAGLRLGHCDFA